MAFDFNTKEAEEKYGAGGGSKDRFEFVDGDNRVRVLAVAEKYLATHFINNKPVLCISEEDGCPYHGDNAPVDEKGKPKKPSVKKLAYVLNHAKGKVELMYMPYSVVKELERYASDPDWGFNEMPMPYDINIKHSPDAAPNEMYKVIPSPRREEIDPAVLQELESKQPLDQIREKIKDKQMAKETAAPHEEEISAKDIPA